MGTVGRRQGDRHRRSTRPARSPSTCTTTPPRTGPAAVHRHREPRCRPAWPPRRATRHGDGHRLLGRHLQRRQQQQPVTSGVADEPVTIDQRSTPPSSRPPPRGHVDRRQGHASAAATTRPARSPSTSTTTPTAAARRCSPTPRTLVGGVATSAGYTATATGHRLLGRHLQRRQQQRRRSPAAPPWSR